MSTDFPTSNAGFLVIGVDGGGTKTEAWLARIANGGAPEVIGRGLAGSSNPRAVGMEMALANLAEAVAAARADAGLGQVAASTGRPRRRRGRVTPLRVSCGLVLIVAGLVHIPSIVSNERIRAAAFQLRLGDNHAALKLADEAVDAAPWAASARAARAFTEIRSGRFNAAAVDAQEAIRLEPTNPRHRELQLRIALLRGDTATVGDANRALGQLGREQVVAP